MTQIYLEQIKVKGMTFYKLQPDAYGNPRYLVHYNELGYNGNSYDDVLAVALAVAEALIGGTKVHHYQYNIQGLKFQSHNLEHTASEIKEAVKAINKHGLKHLLNS